jgi:DNA-binding response OmpR family regulator
MPALLVCAQDAPYLSLKQILEKQGIRTVRARTYAETQNRIEHQVGAPQMIFTDTALPDGTWADVLSLPAVAGARVPVIVVSRLVDLNLYLEVLESGASDFIVPPFEPSDLAYVVRNAMRNVASPPASCAQQVVAASCH